MSDAAEPGREPRHHETSLWTDLRDGLRGTSEDYTAGPVGRAVVLLAVPMVLETVLESVFAVADVFFVSRLGAEAVAAVGLTESLVSLVYTVALGLSIGVTATVARRIGEKDAERAARAAVQAIALGIAIAGVVGAIGLVWAEELLRAMGATESVVAVGAGYTRILLAGNATVLLLFLINAIFRGAGDAAVAMRVLWLANGINLVLDPVLIFGLGPFPELGIVGAAVATTTGRGIAVVVQLVALARGSKRIRVARRHLAIDVAAIARLIRLSATGTLQVFIGSASWVVLMRIMAEFGDEVVAGYTIAFRVVLFALLPAWGLSNAAATLVGQALGAGKARRADRAVGVAGRYNVVFLGSVGLVFLLAAPWIVGALGVEGDTVRWGVQCLRIVSVGFPFYGMGLVLTQSFNGAGDAWTPTLLNLVCFWLFELPVAWVLARPVGMGPTGVFLAITIAYSSLALLSGGVFRRGRWKAHTV